MTVRTLILLRHAKAANPDDYDTDIERPLAPRGHRDATAAGDWLRSEGLTPDAVLCSTAVRTRETLADLRLADTVPVIYEHRIYVGSAEDTLDLVQHVDAATETLLLIGHNPTISDLSDTLAPRALPDGVLPTSGIAVHRFKGTWHDVGTAPLATQHTARG
ncbi:SixA phosphatase family protein [Dactylosporangium darangshiense]|uniref:Histidine phosphatase family protein n=1 Tax=Dactylosporangium darangshiense TaxID=579108 RepID=A0ABP8CVF2_9ACTN